MQINVIFDKGSGNAHFDLIKARYKHSNKYRNEKEILCVLSITQFFGSWKEVFQLSNNAFFMRFYAQKLSLEENVFSFYSELLAFPTA